MKATRKRVEDSIQIGIVDYLRMVLPERDYRVCSIPNGGSRGPAEGKLLKATGVLAGMPDLMIVGPAGRCWFVEVKSDVGKLSDVQEAMLDWMFARAIPVIIARSIDDVRTALEFWGIKTREAA